MKRLFLITLLIAAPLLAAEAWMVAYDKGLTAVQKGDWGTVAAEMQKAIALKNRELAHTNLRRSAGPYVPHYWLGMARMNLGDMGGAAEAFRISESHGAVQKTPLYAELRASLSKLERASADDQEKEVAAARKTADQAIGRAMSAKVQATTAGATRQDAFRRGTQKLQEAFDLKKRSDLKSVQQAASSATAAATLFAEAATEEKRASAGPVSTTPKATVKKDPAPVVIAEQPREQPRVVQEVPVAKTEEPPVQKSQTQVADGSAKARSEADAILRQLRNDLNRARNSRRNEASVVTFTTTALELVDTWQRNLGQANEGDIVAIKRGAAQQKRQLEQITAKAPVTAAAVPAATDSIPAAARGDLQRAYVQLARGDVAAAEKLTSTILAGQPKLFEAYMLRGCARYTQAMLLNRKDLEAAAADDFRAALAIRPKATLDPQTFSPKLVAFFKEIQRHRG